MPTRAHFFDDQREAQKRHEDDIEFVEASEEATKTFAAAEQSRDLVWTPLPRFAVGPGLAAYRPRWVHRDEPEIERQLAGVASFVRRIHEQPAATL